MMGGGEGRGAETRESGGAARARARGRGERAGVSVHPTSQRGLKRDFSKACSHEGAAERPTGLGKARSNALAAHTVALAPTILCRTARPRPRLELGGLREGRRSAASSMMKSSRSMSSVAAPPPPLLVDAPAPDDAPPAPPLLLPPPPSGKLPPAPRGAAAAPPRARLAADGRPLPPPPLARGRPDGDGRAVPAFFRDLAAAGRLAGAAAEEAPVACLAGAAAEEAPVACFLAAGAAADPPPEGLPLALPRSAVPLPTAASSLRFCPAAAAAGDAASPLLAPPWLDRSSLSVLHFGHLIWKRTGFLDCIAGILTSQSVEHPVQLSRSVVPSCFSAMRSVSRGHASRVRAISVTRGSTEFPSVSNMVYACPQTVRAINGERNL